MDKTHLHILNGDSSLKQLEQTSIVGDSFVWREILCEGPTLVDLHTDAFWDVRQTFISAYTNVPYNTIHDHLKRDFFALDLKSYQEIVLWFEYDLFCQINLVALLSWLQKVDVLSYTKLSLICPGDHPSYDKRVGLGELSVSEFAVEFEQRKVLGRDDLRIAHSVWEIYCSKQHNELIRVDLMGDQTSFPYLKDALVAHGHRFPHITTGLNEIEISILRYVDKNAATQKQIVAMLLRRETNYGFGDTQYFEMLNRIVDLFVIKDDLYYLHEKGSKLLNGDLDYTMIRQEAKIFGGTEETSFKWDNQQAKLVVSDNS